ncbi:PAS domain-containing protein [Halobellus rubicundus]|uniref:PAS domain-containing protein n=1 Tax=Halobellus rubicundus TaxID=2996466 RepID=A0ABD5MC30_9EURY
MQIRSSVSQYVSPLQITLLYLLFGFVALFISDILFPIVLDGPRLRLIQSIKGAVEILLTAIFIYLIVWYSWRDLRLKERAIDEAPIGVVITDDRDDDNPVIFANERFQDLTGYDKSEIVGRDCRILQGEQTDPESRAEIRAAIDDDRPVSVDIRNYRKNGGVFWNKVDIAPVRTDDEVTHYVGFQTDITDRKIREQRLEVLNRVLRHNYRNQMNIIQGYVSRLADEETADADTIGRIQRAIDQTLSVTESAHRTERVLDTAVTGRNPVELDARLRAIVDEAREEHPDATVTLSCPDDGPILVGTAGIEAAVEEAVTNALTHHGGDDPTVEVRMTRPREGRVSIAVRDDGPGIPDEEITAVRRGETQLSHGTNMGLWMIQWLVTYAGGTFSITQSDASGTLIELTLPTVAPSADRQR